MYQGSRLESDRAFRAARHAARFALALIIGLAPSRYASAAASSSSQVVHVRLAEWRVTLDPRTVPSGPVVFEVTNEGTIPHAFEVEGHGLEHSTPQIRPGAADTLRLQLKAGSYEVYCPVGKGSHRMLGMKSQLSVGRASSTAPTQPSASESDEAYETRTAPRQMHVVGAGPVIQILPGPFPFADSAMAMIQTRPADQQEDLAHKAHLGPYSNNVATITGDISLLAIDRGATGDSVSGEAHFTTQDGSRWKLVMDRVQTRDIPFNPRFGGVIMGLYYHGASNVHTPLVPTIRSSLALWAVAHLYQNDALVTDDAMVHIMLLSRTRRPGDWALECWDCSDMPIEELQLQVTPPPHASPFAAPGGVLFVNWEKTHGTAQSLGTDTRSKGGESPERDDLESTGR